MVLAFLFAGSARGEDALRVEVKVTGAAYFVGQAIEVRVGVVAASERPKVVPPRVEGAEVTTIDTAFRQVGASGIGNVVNETNLFITRFRITPARAGPLVIPPIHARIGDESGASMPLRLAIQPIPTEERPASWLRGVGRIQARAEAVPPSVRLGEAFDFRIILSGPGARGSTQWPILSEIESNKSLTIQQLNTEMVADPPARTFHFRVRPSTPGDLALPSVAVATFDPTLRRFVETRNPSVTVRVVDVPRFDPANLDLTVPTGEAESLNPRVIRTIMTGLLATVVTFGLILLLARVRTGPRGLVKRYARELRSPTDPSAVAGRVTSGLAAYLFRVSGKGTGQLTPEEASQGIARAVEDVSLADRAGRLIERCDRARFGLDLEAASGLAADAADFFEELGTKKVRRTKA